LGYFQSSNFFGETNIKNNNKVKIRAPHSVLAAGELKELGFPSKNDRSNPFSVKNLGTLRFFPKFRVFLVVQPSNTTKNSKIRAPHSVLAAGEPKELGFPSKNDRSNPFSVDSLGTLGFFS
jgi:hypothetical protein